MYIFRNKSLDNVYSKFKTENLFDLTEEQLEEACKMLDVKPIWNTVQRGGTSRRVNLNRSETIQLIDNTFAFDIYIDQNYWTENHLKQDEELDLIGQLRNHTTGRETFDLMARVRLGISALKPNQTAEVDAPRDWLEEVFATHPIAKYIEIKEKGTSNIVEFDVEKDDKERVVTSNMKVNENSTKSFIGKKEEVAVK